MDDNNSNPPPIPVRPGRVVQIQGIDSLRSEATPNDYVDTNTITGAHTAPQRPPKLHNKDKDASLKAKTELMKDIEQHENIRNELKEHLQESRRSPDIPPRSDRPPPLPPRSCINNKRLPSRPVAGHLSGTPTATLNCNTRKLTSNGSNKTHLPATVLIISEEPASFPQFTTSRSNRQDQAAKDITLPDRPVTQEPTASNVTLMLGEAGTVSNTIICPECGQCRCSDCTGDRKLPERWLCEGNCRCSADSVVDAVTCMWCVKGCFKTIIDNSDGSRIDPCACTESPKCLLRWTALAALSLCLPCLCCYGPMQLGVAAATACYNCKKRGCNCDN